MGKAAISENGVPEQSTGLMIAGITRTFPDRCCMAERCTTNKATPSTTAKAITMATKFACPKTIHRPIHPVMKPVHRVPHIPVKAHDNELLRRNHRCGGAVSSPPEVPYAAERHGEPEDRG